MEKKEHNMTEMYLRNFVKKLRPAEPQIRKQADIGYSWDGKVVYLKEIRA